MNALGWIEEGAPKEGGAKGVESGDAVRWGEVLSCSCAVLEDEV